MTARSAAKTIDLWTPIVADERQHNNYKTILKAGTHASRDVITSWADGFRDRDGKFVQEFQTTFDSAFWELYLFACFKEMNLAPLMDHHSPDFMLTIGDQQVVAEASVAKEADGHRPEWDKLDLVRSRKIVDLPQRLRYTTIRLASRFVSKVEEYRKKYVKLAHAKDRPFLLCVAPFDQPFTFDLAQQAMRRVLYRSDQPIFERDKRSGEAILLGLSEVDRVMKDSGTEFSLGMFCSDAFSDVSAVLFSTTATWGKVRALSMDPEVNTVFRAERYNAYETVPLLIVGQKPHYSETLLDGLILCVNPFAKHPIDVGPFLNREIAIETWHREAEMWIGEAPHEWLIRRFCMTLNPVLEIDRQPLPRGKKYKEMKVPKWPDGELRQVPVMMWPASSNWMAHVGGWTVVVLQDCIDGTWHGFAVEQIAHTIPEVRELNLRGKVRSVWKLDDHPTRETAFSSVKAAIVAAKNSKTPHKRKKSARQHRNRKK